MQIRIYYLFIVVISIFTTSPVLATEGEHDNCGGDKTIHTAKMGAVDEADLHDHIIWAQDRLRKMHGHTPRAVWGRAETREHLVDMQAAMRQLHNQMYEGGCAGAIHGTTLESRVKVLEQHINRM